MTKVCSIDKCGRKPFGRGFCQMHYARWRRHGDPLFRKKDISPSDNPEILLVRFNEKWRLDESTECWVWIGTKQKPSSKYRYELGQMIVNNKRRRAPQVSWELYRGPIPSGAHVLHRCDNSLCVNPDHLYLGSHGDNMRDMAVRQRSGRLKLSASQVQEIRLSTERTSRLAAKYGVDKSTIKGIRNGAERRHV